MSDDANKEDNSEFFSHEIRKLEEVIQMLRGPHPGFPRRGAPGGFDPLSFSPYLWHEIRNAGTSVSGGGIVSTPDLSGNGFTLKQDTVGDRPAYNSSSANLNNYASCTMDGAGDHLETDYNLTFSGVFTKFFVVGGATSFGGCFGFTGQSGAYVSLQRSTDSYVFGAANSQKFLPGGAGLYQLTGPTILRYQCDGTHAGHKVFYNGVEQAVTDGFATGDPGAGTFASCALAIGIDHLGGGTSVAVELGADMLFNRLLSAPESLAVETYFSLVYGIAI